MLRFRCRDSVRLAILFLNCFTRIFPLYEFELTVTLSHITSEADRDALFLLSLSNLFIADKRFINFFFQLAEKST